MPPRPHHRVCPGVSHVAMCGVRWQNGMHFGARISTCPACEAAMEKAFKRYEKQKAARLAATRKRSEAYYK